MGEAGVMRLGVIGLSEGNGHPYSWSAICNGYDPAAMASCPFPVIPQYLAERRFPEDQLPDVSVTHIWTQSPSISAHVAAAARIPHVVDSLDQMIGAVDGILLARDDAERHVEMSLPFLRAGLPIYIDKPIAVTRADLARLFEAQRYEGQIFSCSALRFSGALQLDAETRARLGPIRHVEASVPKAWSTYGVHLVDPLLAVTSHYGQTCAVTAAGGHEAGVVHLRFSDMTATLTCLGKLPGELKFRFYGAQAFADRVFSDTFLSFRAALAEFVEGVRTGTTRTTREELTTVVQILEDGSHDR